MKKVLSVLSEAVLGLAVFSTGGSPAQAATYGSITGMISGVGPAPDSIYATALRYLPDDDEDHWPEAKRVTVKPDGSYSLTGLAAGTYTVCFQGNYVEADDSAEFCLGGRPSRDDNSTKYVVKANTNTPIPEERYSSVSGTVTGPEGELLAGIGVTHFRGTRDIDATGTAWTSPAGVYALNFIPRKQLRLGFSLGPGAFLAEYHDNKATLRTADPLNSGGPRVVDAQLDRAATLAGALKLPSNATSTDANVIAYDRATGERAGWAVASRSSDPAKRGKFTIEGLRPGSYKVSFAQAKGVAFAPAHFYLGKKERNGVKGGTTVVLTAGSTTSIADTLRFADAGRVKGRIVRVSGGKKVAAKGYEIEVMRPDGLLSTRTAITDSRGNFRVTGLAPGNYQLVVRKPGGARKTLGPVSNVTANTNKLVGTKTYR